MVDGPADVTQWNVYVSYKQADRAQARVVAEALRAAGLRTWFDEWKMADFWGKNIAEELDKVIRSSRIVLPVVEDVDYSNPYTLATIVSQVRATLAATWPDGIPPPTDSPTGWRVEWARSVAILAAALFFIAANTAELVFPPEVIEALRDNAIAAIAIYGAVLATLNRKQK